MNQIQPSKHLGQNFLIDKKVVKKIIKAANLKSTDTVLEIGPGLGALTKELVKKVKQVIACEKDPRMCEILKEGLKDFKNIEIINQDILKSQITNSKLQINSNIKSNPSGSPLRVQQNYKIVANLPFYITAPVIRKFLETKFPPKEMVLLVQKEVAQRICARPPDMNLLAISVQFYARPKIISYVSKESFWPQPKVDAAIIRIIPFNPLKKFAWAHSHFASPRRASAFRMLFFKIVKAGFSHPRKQLVNNLLALSLLNGLKLNKPFTFPRKKVKGKQELSSLLLKTNIQPSQRAETLFIKDWLNLTKVL